MRTQVSMQRHPHDDAPDTTDDFLRLAELPAGQERDDLRAEIVEAWMPMAERLAGRFTGRGESYEDLCQVAALGLVEAVDRYDPARGNAFESYAVPTVVGEIKRHFRDHMWALHVPRRIQDLRNRVRSACQDLSGSVSDRSPCVREIAEYTHLCEADVRVGLEALQTFSALSLDAGLPGSESGYSLVDTLGKDDLALDTVVDREAVRPRLQALPERERAILYMRFFKHMTQSRIAEQFGISQMHVSRLISRSCHQVRDEVLQDGGGPSPYDSWQVAGDVPGADNGQGARR